MTLIDEKEDNLKVNLDEAERLHNTGDLSGALKAYRNAFKYVTDQETEENIQHHIDELHEMVAFVETIQENDKQDIKEKIIDWFKDHAITIFALLILITAIIVISLLFPFFMHLFSRNATPTPEPSISEENQPDSFEEKSDQSAPVQTLKGQLEDTGMTIEESNSRITLTIPSKFMSPYPIRFVIQNETPVFILPEKTSPPLTQLPINARVSLLDKSQNEQWLKIKDPTGNKGWIESKYLADERFISTEELDESIKSALGNRYWQIRVEGQMAPYSYFLLINAPDANSAYTAISEAYQSFVSRQMVQMLNTFSHQKIKNIQLVAKKYINQKNELLVTFDLTKVHIDGKKSSAGQKSFTIPQRKDGRYFLFQALESH